MPPFDAQSRNSARRLQPDLWKPVKRADVNGSVWIDALTAADGGRGTETMVQALP